jgi:outer membrane protein assembly factor BamA
LEKNKGPQSGIGLKIHRETRDNRLNAKKGSFLLFEFMDYGKWIGSKFEYNSVILDYRKFVSPNN